MKCFFINLQVRFVDYGNVESCSVDDLLTPSARLCHIPIQTRKYCLANLRPLKTTENGRWNQKALDFLHSHVVDKVANVSRVPEADKDDVTPCRIVVDSINIHDLLVEQDHAIYTDGSKNGDRISYNETTCIDNTIIPRRSKKTSIEISSLSLSSSFEDVNLSSKDGGGESLTKTTVQSSVREPARSYDQYKALFAAIERPMLAAQINITVDEDEDPEEEFCAAQSIVDAAFSALDDSDLDDGPTSNAVMTHFDPTDVASSETSTFDPFAASTPASSESSESLKHWTRQYPFTQFKTIRLKQTQYTAQPILVVNSLYVWLRLEKTPHNVVWNKMSRYLNQKNVPPPPRAPNNLIKPGLLCVSMYHEDSKYYRAMVTNNDEILDEVTIVFIDYLNVEIVSAKDILVCPPKVVNIPLQIVLVMIHGLKRNARWNEAKTKRRLGQAFVDGTMPLQVVVVQPAIDDKLAEVELHDKHGLVYQDMIAEGYYVVKQ